MIPVDANGDYIGDGSINIQFINYLGKMTTSYAYYGQGEYYDGEHTDAGWYDEDNNALAEYTFAASEGFQVYGNCECKFLYSGAVNLAETDVAFRRGLSFQANIRPSEIDIQEIIPVDNEGNYVGDGDVNIQFFTYLGKLITSYAYYGQGEYYDGEHTDAGWYDEDNNKLATYTFAAGEGFKIYSGKAGYLRFPEM